MKGKISNNKFKIFAGLITLIIVFTTIVSTKINYNKTENPVTTVDGAYALTATDFVSHALKLGREGMDYNGRHYTHFCCSNYIRAIINDMGGKIVDSNGQECNSIWAGAGQNQKILINGQYGDIVLVDSAWKNAGQAWYDAIDKTKLQMGDIVVTNQHTFIYLGQGNTESEFENSIAQKLGGDASTLFAGIEKLGGGSTFYTIEGNINSQRDHGICYVCGNQNATRAAIRNYGWQTSIRQDKSTPPGNAQFYVYRIANLPTYGNFSMEVSKVDRDNPNTKLSGAQYNFQDRNRSPVHVYTNGNAGEGQVKKGNAITTGSNGTAQLPVGGAPDAYTQNISGAGDYLYSYSMQEVKAPDGYSLNGGDLNQHFGFKVCTALVGDEYRVVSVDIYYGAWNSRTENKTWLWVTPGNTIWYTTSGSFTRTDPGASNTVAKFTLDPSGTNMKLHTTYYNKKITGNYRVNIVKKPEGKTYDNEINPNIKYQTAMANAKFEVIQYLDSNSLDNLPATPSSYGRVNGRNDNVVVTEAGKATPILFKERTSENYVNNVSILNTNNTDIYTFNETEAPEGTENEWTRGAIALFVYKKVEGNDYVINKVKLQTGNKSYEVVAPASGSAWIRIDKNGDLVNDINNYAIAYEINKSTINVTWRNPLEKTDKYNLEIKKIDKKTGQPLQNVQFDINSKSLTTGSDGTAQYGEVTIDKTNVNTVDTYTVEEKNLGSNSSKYYLLSAPFSFEVKKEYNQSTREYKITGVRFTGESNFQTTITKNVKDSSDSDVTITISMDNATKTITITAENNPVTPGSFYLRKTDKSGTTDLNTTSFKIDRYDVADYRNMQLNNPTTVLNGELSTKANGLIEKIDPMETNPKAYVYDIHETTAAAGYLNVFKKKVNGQDVELAYIRLIIRNDENNQFVATQEIIKTSNCSDAELEEIKGYVDNPTVNQTTREVRLNIKNPGTQVKFGVEKSRYNTAGSTAGGTYKIELDGTEIDSSALTSNGDFKYTKDNITVGDHTLRIYELTPPAGCDNVFDEFANVDGVKIEFTVNEDGTVTFKERTIGNVNYKFIPESQSHVENTQDIAEISKYVVVSKAVFDDNNIKVYIKDPTHFDFELYKKEYTGKSDISQEAKFNGTANFKINRVLPTAEDKFNGALPTDTQTKFFTEGKVQVKTTYVYDIKEISVSSGYYQNLVGKTIKVYVSVDERGNLNDESTGASKYEIYDENETKITGSAKEKLDAFIKFDVDPSTKKVNLYIANMPENYYQVRICKVDTNGNPYKRAATFSSRMTTSTSTTEKTRTGINTNTRTGIATITDGNEVVERGATHTYEITETKAPAGCIKIDGTIKLDVLFNSSNTGNAIQNATVKYIKNGTETLLDGLDVDYNQSGNSVPLVTVYVPNEGRDFEFELQKVDSLGNLIEASTDSQGNINGIEFKVQRVNVVQNPEVEIPAAEASDFQAMLQEIADGFNADGNFQGMLEDGRYTDKAPLGENLKYDYAITEIKAKEGYGKELVDKQINMSVYTKKDTNNKPYIDKVTFTILDTKNNNADVTSEYEKYITASINSEKTKVTLLIENPNAYRVKLRKTDLAGKEIDSAIIEAYKDNQKIVTLNEIEGGYIPDETEKISDYVGIEKGEEQVWKIYERKVESPYYNVFGQDKYVEVKVKMNNSGVVSVTGYTVKDRNGTEHADLKQYIEKVTIVDDIVNVTFKDPSGYRLIIDKVDADGSTPLSGAVVKLDNKTVISGGESHYQEDFVAGASTTKTYTITETSTVANHVNVLQGKEIKLTVNTDAKGKITRSYKIMSGNTEVPQSDKVYQYLSVGDVRIIDGETVIEVKIINPLVGKYNVKLYKVDENGNLIKNYSARFQGTRNSGSMNAMTIDAHTSNGVATIDSNAEINNVNDSNHYQLEETEAPLGYEKLASKIILDTYYKDTGDKLTIDETRTQLRVGRNTIPMSSADNQFIDDNSQAWYIDNSANTVTINIYIKNTKKKFDLALRKYISKVENTNKNETPNPYREPSIWNLSSLTALLKNHTIDYYHTKEAYKVEVGDIVTYRINVYNEGNVKGYATEITDYLESGLEFIDNDFNSHYGWSATKNSDGTTTVTTNYLAETLLNECGLNIEIAEQEAPRWNAYVEIQCKVVREATKERSYITDRAEITADKAVEINANNEEIEIELDDIDSQPLNVKNLHNKEMLNYDPTISYSTDVYYPGFQDDDDKETVYIEKHEYDFVLSKTDGEEEISGARFKIEELKDNGNYETLYNGSINKNITIHEPDAIGESSVELYRTYTYKITEASTVNSNYDNLLAGKYIIVKTHLTEGMNQLHKGEYGSPDEYYSTYGYAIFDEGGSLITTTDEDGDLYDQIEVTINNESVPPQIKITIPNERLYFGSYKINMKKVDTNNNPLEGIGFSVNEWHDYTDTNGLINVSAHHVDAENDGTVNIDKYNLNTVDMYRIREDISSDGSDESVEPDEGYTTEQHYIRLLSSIDVSITKGFDATNEKYFVNNVHIGYNGNESIDIPLANANSSATRNISLLLVDESYVQATITVASNGTITIVAQNKEKRGEYQLRVYKVDENNQPVNNIHFSIDEESTDLVTGNDGYTRTITKEITTENLNTPDEYTITEGVDGQGRVIRLKNPIKLTVNKKNDITKYTTDLIKLTDLGTGTESMESVARTELSNLEIDDNSGRTVTVQAIVELDGTITLIFENPPVRDNIQLKIKKVNAKDNSPINGITFGVRFNNGPSYEIETENSNGEDGIALVDSRMVSSANTYTYVIRETGIPSTPEDLIFLSDVDWRVRFDTKYDEDAGRYIIDRSSVDVVANNIQGDASIEERAKQLEIANRIRANVSNDNATLTLTIQNEQTTDFGLTIRKADMDTNEDISQARFTIKENGRTIAEDKTIAEFPRSLANKTGLYVNTTYTYEIYETSPAPDYQNILEKTYIKLVITLGADGAATANYEIKAQPNGTSADVSRVVSKINEYVSNNSDVSSFLEQNGNQFTLNIPNPKDTITVSSDLIKFETGDESKKVNNAVFSVKKTTFDDSTEGTVSAAVSRFDYDTSVVDLSGITTSNATNWIERNFTATFGKVYYYELTETSVPTNYESEFYSAIVKMYLAKENNQNVVKAEVVKIKLTDTSSWEDYSSANHGSKLSTVVNGNTVHVKWANELGYKIRILKKSYNSTIPTGGASAIPDPASGANMTITSSNGNTTLVDGLMHESELYYEDEVHSNTTYTYVIKENNAPQGHYNLFEDMEIVVNARVGANGVLSQSNSTIDVRAQAGKTVSQEKLMEARNNVALVIDTEANIADVYIANKQIHNTFDLQIMKISDKTEIDPVTGEQRAKGVEGIVFSVLGSQQQLLGRGATDQNGVFTITGIEPNGVDTLYGIREDTQSAINAGVTPLHDAIALYLDLTGIDASMSIEEIEEALNETNPDGTPARFNLVLDSRDEGLGASVHVEGRTIVVMIKNRTTDMSFNLSKIDPAGTRISGSTVDGEYITGPQFRIVNSESNPDLVLWDDELPASGGYTKFTHTQPNEWYEYTVREKATKEGFINVIQGYDIIVHLQADTDGSIVDPANDARTYFTLVPNGIEPTAYTIQDILDNNWVRLTVSHQTETDTDTGNDVIVSSSVTLAVVNPYEYKLELNKKDKDGSTPLSVASITAERISGADVSKIYNHGSLDERAAVLTQIAHATDTGAVHVETNSIINNFRAPTVTSREFLVDLQGRYAEYDNEQLWRITESNVDAPYRNILEDKYIVIDTYYTGSLQLAKHGDPTTSQFLSFYVIDKDGNDVTLDYLDYIDVSTEQDGPQWKVVVTIKNPMSFKVGLSKIEDFGTNNIPLSGAHLKLQLGDQVDEIDNGESNSDLLVQELAIGDSVDAIVNEFSTPKGHKNILAGKTLKYTFTNVDGDIIASAPEITENGVPVSAEEYYYIMGHVTLTKYTDDDGLTSFGILVENPVDVKVDLTKLDIGGNPLDETKIKVESSYSGIHMLDGQSNISFVEEDVPYSKIITYTITEINTKEGAYINKFEDPIRITAQVLSGQFYLRKMELYTNGEWVEFQNGDLEYFNCYMNPESKDDLNDGELQTLTIEMENPPEIEVELLKTQARSSNTTPVKSVVFTIDSINTHINGTNSQGKINYTEEVHQPGDYTIRVYENYGADNKYVNVLEGKYMQFDITVAADGTITIKNDGQKRFFYKDSDTYFDNDVEIIGDEAAKLAEYCSMDSRGNKLYIHIEDPVKFDLSVIKKAMDGSTLEGAEFEITSVEGLVDTIRRNTDANGEINERMNWVNPGVYEYHITEINAADVKYDNVLLGNMIVAYVKVAGNGDITLVADSEGTAFTNNVPISQRYVVKKLDGTAASDEDEARIREFCTVNYTNNDRQPDMFTVTVKNPIQTKLDIIKRQYNTLGQEEVLTNTKFTVMKNNNEQLLNNAIVNEEVEIEEHDLVNSSDYYDIYEDSTNQEGAYVNVLQGRFIRVYTKLDADGTLKVVDDGGNDSPHYFEIYKRRGRGPATLLDRTEHSVLYDDIDVWAETNRDGIYVLNVKVINPITIDVGVLKKQYGENANTIRDVSITVVSANTGEHDIVTTSTEEVFSDGNIKPGTYDYIVKENNNPDKRYVNVLENRYAKFNVTISKEGAITCNNVKFYVDNNDNDYTNDPEVSAETRALLQDKVYAVIDDSTRIQKITFVIENPVTLKFLVHKLDLLDGGLEGATFNVIKYVGDSNEVAKGMTSVDTDNDGVITFEDGDYMKAGIYRYEITELKPAAEKYVNILDCYDDGSQYKVVMYLKLNLDGTTEYLIDAQGTPYTNAGRTPYIIVNRNDSTAAIPAEVTEIVHKYLTVSKTDSRGSNPDKFDVEVTNTPQIDIDVVKVTKEDGVEKSLSGTKFSAEADDGVGLFEDILATQDKEYTYKNVSAGRHEFYLTESEGAAERGYINVLENRYVRVITTVSADGEMKITDRLGNEHPGYFEIYDGDYNDRAGSRLLDTIQYADIYDCISVDAVQQSNGVYKLVLKVTNPERNYNIKLNKKVFGNDDINMEGVEFYIRGTVDNEGHQLTTDRDGNISFEEKRVPVGIYTYYVTEINTTGPEFVNVLENNYIVVGLKVNQDGTIEIVDMSGETEGNENKYYILDSGCTQIIDPSTTIVDDFVRVATNNRGTEPELNFFIKDPEKFNFKLVKKDDLTDENLNNVTFTTSVYYQAAGEDADPSDADRVTLVNADTFENIDISTVKTANIDGVDGVISVPNILVNKTGTYTFVFHEESTDGLFKYLYKSHAEDITLKVDITVEENNEGRPIGYKVGQPTIVTGARYVDEDATQTTQEKVQTVETEVLNTPIRGHFNLVLSKLDKYTSRKLDGAEFNIRAEKDGSEYELYEDVDDLRIENAVIPTDVTVQNGELVIENIRITPPPYQAPEADGTLETFKIILTETKAPTGYMLLDDPIVLEVTTAVDGEYDDAEYVVKSVNLISGENHGLVTRTFGKNEINVVAYNEYFDLALRKSIVSVAYSDSDDGKITEADTADRVPVIYEDDEIYDLNPSVTTANYRHVKNHVRVYPGQEVIYKLRIYNEGEIDGYAEEITDHLPEGLEFMATDKFNTDRGWSYDLNDQSLRTVKTTFLSKDNNPNNDRFNAENNLIKAMDENVATGVEHELDFVEIEIKCKVSENIRPGVILTNIAEITEYKAEDRTQETVDRDSVAGNADVPNGKDLQNYKEDELTDDRRDYVPGQEDDDDFEKLITVEFDLALRKYITAINDEEVLADKVEAKYTDEVVSDTEDILGNGTASDDAEGTNDGANTNIIDESEGGNGNTDNVNNAQTTGENPENINTDEESDEEDIDDDNKIKYDREPRVNVSTLKSGDLDSIYKDPEEPTTALYNHTKAPVEVSVDDIVTYTLEIFNEGTVDGYASLIKDDIPEGVEFVQYQEGDGSVNDKYRWKMVDENGDEVTDPKDAKYITTDYLSKENGLDNIIRAFDPETGTRLDSKYVQVQFRVICKQDYPKIITNYAQISDDTDDGGRAVKDRDSTPDEWIDGEDDQDVEHIWVTYMDLALRKFITGVTDYKTGKTEEITYRIPQVDPTALIDETGTTAKYEHTKEPVLVHTNDVVIYTISVYNEGSKDGYATQIKDDLPEGLEFLPDHKINKYYEWSLVDENDKGVTNVADAKYAVTNYLSKDKETEKRPNLIKAFDYYDYENDKPAKRDKPDHKEVQIAFKVTEPQTSDRILINEAQISEQTDGKGIHREDRDSTPNKWLGEDDEDIEKVRVLYFDLALRKWVTKAIVTQNGEEKVIETGHHAEDDPEDVVKVDLKKSKLNKVVVKFEYQIRITNEGEIDGYAKKIKDRIPEGLRFDPADNPTWTQLEENIIVTDELKDTLLKPGESAEVTVVLTWINSGDNLGLKVNVAEISKDYNDYGTHDIDSTPDNNVWGEDDIDDAPVMLAVKTGNAVYGYALLAVFVGAIIVLGARRIKKINEG